MHDEEGEQKDGKFFAMEDGNGSFERENQGRVGNDIQIFKMTQNSNLQTPIFTGGNEEDEERKQSSGKVNHFDDLLE